MPVQELELTHEPEYIVTVTRRRYEKKPPGTSYENLHKRNDSGDGDEWGYISTPEKIEMVTTTIFTQTVANINLLDVVAAVIGVSLP